METYKVARENLVEVAKRVGGSIASPLSEKPAIYLHTGFGSPDMKVRVELGDVIECLDDGRFQVWVNGELKEVATSPEDIVEAMKEDRPAELKKFRTGDPQAVAVALVNALYYKGELPSEDVYIVWFCATLQNWKALVSTNVKDNSYYEVTHNGTAKETYVDKYVKHDHYTIPDSFLQD